MYGRFAYNMIHYGSDAPLSNAADGWWGNYKYRRVVVRQVPEA